MNKKFWTLLIAVVLVAAAIGFLKLKNPNQNSPNASQNQQIKTIKKIEGFSGNVLAGEKSPYLEFNKIDYDKALASNKIVFLDFYANWCPICRAEAPELTAGFDSLTSDNVIGFRVNFNDSDTDNDEKTLAKQFEIPYQHTKVILKDTKVALIDSDSWDKSRFEQEIAKLTQ